MPDLLAACAWVHSHAPAIERLQLDMALRPADPELLSEAEAAIAAVCASCGTAGQLRELALFVKDVPLTLGSWVTEFGSLQCMKITAIGEMVYPCPLTVHNFLERATALRELHLCGRPLVLSEGRLPTAHLTKLELAGLDAEESLPLGLTHLFNLRHLSLSELPQQTDFQLLAQLSNLRTLSVEDVPDFSHSVPTLSALTSLRSLYIICPGSTDANATPNMAALDAALAPLTLLTYLQVRCIPLAGLPPSIGSLPHLQRFCYESGSSLSDSILCSGPWLLSLRRLLVPPALVANSRQQLLAAPQLECLGFNFCKFPKLPVPQQINLLRLVAELPALAVLGLGLNAFELTAEDALSQLEGPTVAEIGRLSQRKPGLRFEWGAGIFEEELFDPDAP